MDALSILPSDGIDGGLEDKKIVFFTAKGFSDITHHLRVRNIEYDEGTVKQEKITAYDDIFSFRDKSYDAGMFQVVPLEEKNREKDFHFIAKDIKHRVNIEVIFSFIAEECQFERTTLFRISQLYKYIGINLVKKIQLRRMGLLKTSWKPCRTQIVQEYTQKFVFTNNGNAFLPDNAQMCQPAHYLTLKSSTNSEEAQESAGNEVEHTKKFPCYK